MRRRWPAGTQLPASVLQAARHGLKFFGAVRE